MALERRDLGLSRLDDEAAQRRQVADVVQRRGPPPRRTSASAVVLGAQLDDGMFAGNIARSRGHSADWRSAARALVRRDGVRDESARSIVAIQLARRLSFPRPRRVLYNASSSPSYVEACWWEVNARSGDAWLSPAPAKRLARVSSVTWTK